MTSVEDVRRFHAALEGYAVTPLVDLPEVARELGVGRVVAKDESHRLGLPAFKALGASWAVHRALQEHTGPRPVTLVTATDGNHGRAVARFARRQGQHARVVVPTGVHPTAVAAIEAEGAVVTVMDGSYDDAVAAAAALAQDDDAILVQDTAWPGYEEVPGWIVDGYATLFGEAQEQLVSQGIAGPDLVVVPAGVGSLLQAALAFYRGQVHPTAVVSVEPVTAACVQASVRAGHPVTVPTLETIMAGLNCGTVSSLAWPLIATELAGAVAVSDEEARTSAASLERFGVPSGPCGGAGLAGLRRVVPSGGADSLRTATGLDEQSTVMMIVTESAEANPS